MFIKRVILLANDTSRREVPDRIANFADYDNCTMHNQMQLGLGRVDFF